MSILVRMTPFKGDNQLYPRKTTKLETEYCNYYKNKSFNVND